MTSSLIICWWVSLLVLPFTTEIYNARPPTFVSNVKMQDVLEVVIGVIQVTIRHIDGEEVTGRQQRQALDLVAHGAMRTYRSVENAVMRGASIGPGQPVTVTTQEPEPTDKGVDWSIDHVVYKDAHCLS